MTTKPGFAPSRPAICFDATGTLIEIAEPVGETYRRVALEHGVDLPAWRLDDAFRRILQQAPPLGVEGASESERQSGEVAWWSERIRQTFQATDSTVRFPDFAAFAEQLFEAFQSPDAWRIRDGIGELLSRLAAEDCPMSVVSNFDHRLPKILESIDLARFFVSIEIPSKTGSAKPDRVIFEAAAKALGRSLDALSYLGDDPDDVLAAIRGHAIRVFSVHEIEDLDALPDLLLSAATLPTNPND